MPVQYQYSSIEHVALGKTIPVEYQYSNVEHIALEKP